MYKMVISQVYFLSKFSIFQIARRLNWQKSAQNDKDQGSFDCRLLFIVHMCKRYYLQSFLPLSKILFFGC